MGQLHYSVRERELSDSLTMLEAKLDEVSHVGMLPRVGFSRRVHPLPWKDFGRIVHALGFRVSTVLNVCELGRIDHREDFDYTLQVLRAGHKTALLTTMCVGDRKFGDRGGSSASNRSFDAANADALKLARLHPGLVEAVPGKYRTTGDRLEVRIKWSKAFNYDAKLHPRTFF